jgi:hypothetical protein
MNFVKKQIKIKQKYKKMPDLKKTYKTFNKPAHPPGGTFLESYRWQDLS